MSSRALQCSICQQLGGEEQPNYCLHCFIPITVYKHGDFLGQPPASTLTTDMVTIKQAQEAIESLGIEHLSLAEQAVALSSLAREKMNLMSGDYEFSQAVQLAQMGMLLAEKTTDQWAKDATATVHATSLVRLGKTIAAVKLLQTIVPGLPKNTEIEGLRRLEAIALLALAYRSNGDGLQADDTLQLVLIAVNDEFVQLEIQLAKYVEESNIKSEYLGLNNRNTRFPRVDYFTRIISILVEESVVRGGKNTPLPDDTLDRMLELDNITHQLSRISPPDDPGFFAAQLREYLRLFNGIFWYGDIMINNDATKRRLLIERTYTRIHEWMEFLPVHFWLSLRLARFLEIFSRAQSWSEKIDIISITERLLAKASKLHKPSFLYVFAEFTANAGQYERALDYIKELLSPNYEKDLEPALQSMAQRMQQSIELETVGILMGVTKPNDWITGIISVEVGDKVIDMDSQSEVMQFGIAIFGERLITHTKKIKARIKRVGPRTADDRAWQTSLTGQNVKLKGLRMDMVLIKVDTEKDNIYLLFEGKKQQQIPLTEKSIRLEPSELLLLRAIKHSKELRVDDIIQLLADILTGHSSGEVEVSTLV